MTLIHKCILDAKVISTISLAMVRLFGSAEYLKVSNPALITSTRGSPSEAGASAWRIQPLKGNNDLLDVYCRSPIPVASFFKRVVGM